MSLTLRGKIVALTTTAALGFGAGALTVALSVGQEAASVGTDLVRYEDGSGVLYRGDQEVGTYPEGTFVWDCTSMGDLHCGNIDDADIYGVSQ